MNARLLFAATVAVSALATFASMTVLADVGPLTRARVNAEFEQALPGDRTGTASAKPGLARLFRGNQTGS